MLSVATAKMQAAGHVLWGRLYCMCVVQISFGAQMANLKQPAPLVRIEHQFWQLAKPAGNT